MGYGKDAQRRRARRVSSVSFRRRKTLYVSAGPPSDAARAVDERSRAGRASGARNRRRGSKEAMFEDFRARCAFGVGCWGRWDCFVGGSFEV